MQHIDFHISYRCVNKCIFCSSYDSIAQFKERPLGYEKIIRILKTKSKQFRSVNFTGGEPTMLSFLPRLLEEAKGLGYQIYVGTNGAGFAENEFCRKAAPFIDKVSFSFHGYNKKLHDFHTARRGSFDNLNKALSNLSRYPLYFMSNTVITRYNFPHLKEILSFLAAKKIKQVLFSNLAPEGKGLENYKLLTVKLGDIKEKAAALAELANRKDIVLRFFAVPACILRDYAAHSNDFYWDERLNIEQAKEKGKVIIKEEKAIFPSRRRIKVEKCKACLYFNICAGVFEAYYNMFGDSELEPIGK